MEKNAVGLKRSVLKFGETRHYSQETFQLASVFSLQDVARFCTEMLEPVVTVNKYPKTPACWF